MAEDAIALRILKRYEHMKGDRGTWENHWQDVSDLVLPSREFTKSLYPGTKRHNQVFDTTAPQAADRLAGSLSGLLINPSLIWFYLRTPDDKINEQEEARAWLQEVSFRLLWLFNTPRFGFYAAMHECLLDLVTYGTSVLFNENTTSELRYESIPLGSTMVAENSKGTVDTVYREFTYTSSQAAEAFGRDNLTDKIKTDLEANKSEKVFPFLQVVMPRRERDAMSLKAEDKPWASYTISIDDKARVKTSGFDNFPFVVPRWTKKADETYGISPAMQVLPSIKLVNAMTKTMLVAAEKSADPPLLVPDDGMITPLRTAPGGLTYIRDGMRVLPQPLNNNARMDVNAEMIAQQQQAIEKAFFMDMFELPIIDRMTATEVQQRQREKQQTLNPVLARIQKELIGPVIDNAFSALVKADALPPIPEALAGRDLQVDYQSPLALAQRASEAAGFTQWLALMEPVLAMDPSAASNINADEVANWAKGMFNVPQRIMRPRKEVEDARQAEAEKIEQQEQMAMAQQGAAAAKDAGAAAQNLETLDVLAG